MDAQTSGHLSGVLKEFKWQYGSVFGFSAVANFLLLAPSWYMLQVYDRVLTSYDENTLLGLSLIVAFLYVIYALLEKYRGFVLINIAEKLDESVVPKIYGLLLNQSSLSTVPSKNTLNDLNVIKQFLTGQSIISFLDVPWVPIYLITIAALHPELGLAALGSVLLLLILAVINQAATGDRVHKAEEARLQEHKLVTNTINNIDSIRAMGMGPAFKRDLGGIRKKYLTNLLDASIRGSGLSSLAKFFRIAIQSFLLGYGAYLAINQELTAGMMIAASILLGRALAPIEGVTNAWRQLAEFKKAYRNLNATLSSSYQSNYSIEFERPKGKIELVNVSLMLRSAGKPTLEGFNLAINPGESLAIIGPSGAGKSSLLKILCGVYQPSSGRVLIDGSDIAFRNMESLGKYIGYLSQTIELFPGTIAQNIARFGELESKAVLQAAENCGAHDTILSLPEGYETVLGDFGSGLSEGQKRKVGLARAIYKNPSLVFLDEPGTGLDDKSMAGVFNLLSLLKGENVTLVYTTHQPTLAQLADRILLLIDGQIKMHGPSAQIIQVLQDKGRGGGA